MIAYLLLGLCLLIGLFLLVHWFVGTDPSQVKRALKWVLVFLGVALIVWFALAGRQALVVLALPALIPVLMRLRGAWQRLKAFSGPRPGQSSGVSTRFLRMSLDHESGEMDGIVLEGKFKGHALRDLEVGSLIELWRECRAEDEQSADVLEAYLDRVHGETWREPAGAESERDSRAGRRAESRAPMTREEAFEVLGLEPGAGEDEIRAAHRRLMRHAHPDHGGSNYLAAKINQAKDLLLG